MARLAEPQTVAHQEWCETVCPATDGPFGCDLPSGPGWQLEERFIVKDDDGDLAVYRWVRERGSRVAC